MLKTHLSRYIAVYIGKHFGSE